MIIQILIIIHGLILIYFRFGSQIEEQNGGARKKWKISVKISQTNPSTIKTSKVNVSGYIKFSQVQCVTPYIKWPKSMKLILFLFFTEILAIALIDLGFYFALSPYFREYDIMTNMVNLFGASFIPNAFTLLITSIFMIMCFALIDRMQEKIMNNPQREVLTWAKNILKLYKRVQCSLNTALLLLLFFM